MKKRKKNLPAGRRGKIHFADLQEKAMNWLWVVLLITAIMFLRGLLSDMNTQTNRLSEERKKFQDELTEEREKSQNLYLEFYAELDKSIKKAIEALNK
ncbi:MAG: hypothetical protein HYV47_03860 [Candidatus Nealsonbacteria bacterium]|nr:hypothetical protein [Candidatus Nealsonbacteria bacterium]